MKTSFTHLLLGSALALTASCATELDHDPAASAARDTAPDPSHDHTGCQGEHVDPSGVAAELTFDAIAGLAHVTVHNRASEPMYVEVKLHTRDRRGQLVQTLAPPIVVDPAQASGVRIAVGDVNGDGLGAHLKAELVVRDQSGAIVERAFAHATTGPAIEEVAARLKLPLTAKIEGERAELAAIVRGGAGIDPSALTPPNDVIDDLEVPTAPLPPAAIAYDMCFRWPVTLVDAGFGEDYGTDPTSPWIARGGRVAIYQKGKKLFDSYLDANGCTGPLAASGPTDFTIFGYSRARVAGNDVIVRDDEGVMRSFVIWDADPGLDQTPVFVFPEVEAVSTMLAVSAYTLQKFHSGITGETIAVENRCRPIPNGCCNCDSGGSIWIDDDDRKFLIGHEWGHRLLGLKMGSFNNDVSFDLDPTDTNPLCDTSSTHSMWSMELQSGAAMEGWAHFVSVATFNSREGSNPGAMMRYWSGDGVTVDVEQGPTGGASNYFDDVCPGVATTLTLAVQLDWLRHWWDYYSNDLDVDPGYRPTVSRMMSELDAAPVWGASNAWTRIRAGVKAFSGDTQQQRWDQHGTWNGID